MENSKAAQRSLNETGRKDWFIAACLMLVSVAYYASYYDYGISLYDEGHLVNLSERVLEGQKYYRDWWTIYAPGRFYLFAGLFKLFGTSLIITRLFWLALRVVTAGTYYIVARNVLSARHSMAVSLIVLLVPGNWHSTPITFFPLLFLLCVFTLIKTGSLRWAAYSGLVTGATLFFRQDSGICLFIAGIMLMPLIRYGGFDSPVGMFSRHTLKASSVFTLCASSVLLLYWAVSGAHLMDVLYGLFVKPMEFAKSVSVPFNKISLTDGAGGILNKRNLEGVFFYIPPAACAGTAVALVRMYAKNGLDRYWTSALAVLMVATVNLNHYVWQSNSGHLLKSSAVSYILVAFLLERFNAVGGRGRLSAWLASGTLTVLAVAFVVTYMLSPAFNTGAIGRRLVDTKLLKYDRARVYVAAGLADQIEGVVDYLKNKDNADMNVLVLTHDSMLGFLAGTENPTRYEYFEPGMLDAEDQAKTYHDALKADYVVYYEPGTLLGYPRLVRNRFSFFCGHLYENLLPKFEYEATVGAYQVLKRSEGIHPGTLHFMNGYEDYLYGNDSDAAKEFTAVPPGSAAYGQAQVYMGIINSRRKEVPPAVNEG